MISVIISAVPIIGTGVQFIATVGCKRIFPALSVCSTFGVIAHELTEPVAYHALLKISSPSNDDQENIGFWQYIPTKGEFTARLVGSVSTSYLGNHLIRPYGLGKTIETIADCVFGYIGSTSGAELHQQNYLLNNTLAGEASSVPNDEDRF